jgi:glutaredoxin
MAGRAGRAWALALALALVGCPGKKAGDDAGPDPSASIVVRESSDGLLLTWIDDKGDFHVEQRVADVPIIGRDAVRVVDPSRDVGTHADKVFVADLRVASSDGTYPVHTMTRAAFDQLAVDRRAKTGPTLASAAPNASGDAPVPVQPNSPLAADPRADARPLVIIYGADWCSACHDAAAYLRRKGVAFVEKNVEQDREAAREMNQKLQRSGLRAGSIPVLDVKGKIMVGFNPRSVDEALGRAI